MNRCSLLTSALLAATTPLLTQTTHAIDTWKGGRGDSWTEDSNWVDGTAPDALTSSNQLTFYETGANNLTNYLGSISFRINSLSFNNNADENVAIGLYYRDKNGSQFESALNFNSIGSDKAGDLVLPSITVDQDAGGEFTIGSGGTGTVKLNNHLTVTHNGTNDLTIAGSISDNVLSPSSITKEGSGRLILTNTNNSYGGGTTITGGTLGFAAGSLGTTGNIMVDNGTLQWNAGNSQDVSSRLILGGTATLDTNGNDVTLKQLVGANSSLTKAGNGNLTLSAAAITDTGTTTVNGGNLILTAANTYTGTTTVNGGTLTLSGSGSISESSVIVVGGEESSGAILDASARNTGSWEIRKGQTLKGIGTVQVGSLVINGIHAAGNGSGLQTIDGATTYGATSIFEWDLAANVDTAAGGVRGSTYDAVDINASMTVMDGARFRVIQNKDLDFTNVFWTDDRTWSDIFNVTGGVTDWAANTGVAVYDTSGLLKDVSSFGSFAISGSTLNWT
ncbi:autotransporter-associated beta strand repeat-containing protein, partial [Haloferula sp.]|uniref:autotransporter-associated beta strand repeat-containing protein n=1 Tax=Haloferula sp. TaxID=2497595 RepID=UPI003C75777D